MTSLRRFRPQNFLLKGPSPRNYAKCRLLNRCPDPIWNFTKLGDTSTKLSQLGEPASPIGVAGQTTASFQLKGQETSTRVESCDQNKAEVIAQHHITGLELPSEKVLTLDRTVAISINLNTGIASLKSETSFDGSPRKVDPWKQARFEFLENGLNVISEFQDEAAAGNRVCRHLNLDVACKGREVSQWRLDNGKVTMSLFTEFTRLDTNVVADEKKLSPYLIERPTASLP